MPYSKMRCALNRSSHAAHTNRRALERTRPCSHAWAGQASLQGLPELLREVTVLGVYRHPHIVPLLSFCLSRHGGQQQACLVYPLMARGGLDQALAARRPAAHPLDAAARLRIAADVAAGLAFLHCPGAGLAPMLHRDVKSSNVLLDGELRARVSDVGLARPQHGATMTAGVGTFGYTDPEYFATGERAPPARALRRVLPYRLTNFATRSAPEKLQAAPRSRSHGLDLSGPAIAKTA
jgi:serine/threonine protein kinase